MLSMDEFLLGNDLQYAEEFWFHRTRVRRYGQDKLITLQVKKRRHLARIDGKVEKLEMYPLENRGNIPAVLPELLGMQATFDKNPYCEQKYVRNRRIFKLRH